MATPYDLGAKQNVYNRSFLAETRVPIYELAGSFLTNPIRGNQLAKKKAPLEAFFLPEDSRTISATLLTYRLRCL